MDVQGDHKTRVGITAMKEDEYFVCVIGMTT